MRKKISSLVLIVFLAVNLAGCAAPLILGVAAGAGICYAASRDTVQGDTAKSYEDVWNSALAVSRDRGSIKKEDKNKGYIEVIAGVGVVVRIKVIPLTRSAVRLRVSCRKNHLPNLDIAQDIYTRIIDGSR